MSNNLISIIIVSYKNLEYLKETIDSVLSQTYPNIELIIGDDGTEEFNAKLYKQYIKINSKTNIKNIIVYKNDKNLGTVKNMNKGIDASKGDYIKFIAADDVFFSSDVISKMINYMEKEKIEVLTSNVLYCDNNMNELDDSYGRIQNDRKTLILGIYPNKFFKLLSNTDLIRAPGVMFKASLFNNYGQFDEDYRLVEDWPMWLKLSRHGIKIYYIDIISVRYRVGIGVSTSIKPNHYFLKDISKCYEKDILPYKNELGYWLHKRLKWKFIRIYKFSNYSILKKVVSILTNIDIIIQNKIRNIINKKRKNI